MKAGKEQRNNAGSAATTAEAADEEKQREIPTWRLVFSVDLQIFSFLFLIAACIFTNCVRGGLTFDDHLAIERNHDASANETPISELFFDDFWGKSLDRIESNGSYRPITVLTFRLQHWLAGYRHNPTFLHCFNYLVAFGNVCLVFYLARLYVYVIVPAQALAVEKATVPSFTTVLTSPLHAVPLIASLLYLVHPVHVDAVTSIVGRCELLYCLFGLLGFFCVHRYLNQIDDPLGGLSKGRPAAPSPSSNDKKGGSSSSSSAAAKAVAEERRRVARAAARGFSGRYVVFSAYALMVSILCKDSAITFTAVYGVHACVMYACGRCEKRRVLVVVCAAVMELVSYLAFRRTFIGNVDLVKSPLLRQTENPQYFVPKGFFHWLSIRWVIQVKNMELLFFPTSLCCEYSYNCIPHLFDLQDPRVPYFTAVTAVTVAAVLGFLYGTFVRRSRVAIVGLVSFLWIAIPYAPVSHLFIAVGTFIAERCLYVPSIGAVLLITFFVASPGLRRGTVAPYVYLLFLLCVGWGFFSHHRNYDWLDDERLFRSALRTCPNSGKARSQLASLVSARTKDTTPEVIELAQASIELDPGLHDGYYYLAVYEANKKRDLRKAYDYLRLCLNDPFAVHSCRSTYEQLRGMLFRNMTEVEQFVDDASLTTLDAQKGMMLRHAGVFALQKEHRPCLAAALFEDALNKWNNSQLYWISDQVQRAPGDNTYCNAMYWYPQSLMMCENAPQTDDSDDSSTAPHTAEGVEAYVSLKKPGLPDAAQAAQRATELAERLRPCRTDWHHVMKEPKYYRPTYPFRMTQFLMVSDAVMNSLEHYATFTEPDTPERTAVLLSMLDVSVHQYCHISVLVNDRTVRESVSKDYMGELMTIEQGFFAFRQDRLPRLRTARRQLRSAKAINASQMAQLHDILAASKCSDDLSFLAF